MIDVRIIPTIYTHEHKDLFFVHIQYKLLVQVAKGKAKSSWAVEQEKPSHCLYRCYGDQQHGFNFKGANNIQVGDSVTKNRPGNRKKTLDLKLHTGTQPSLVYYTIYMVARLLFRFYVTVFTNMSKTRCAYVYVYTRTLSFIKLEGY